MTWKSKILITGIGLLAAFGLLELKARADYNVTQGSGTTIFAFTCFTTKVCPSHVPINSAGTEIFTSADPGEVSLREISGTAVAVNSGNASAGTQRVTLATDDAAIATVVTALGNPVPVGSNVIGRTYPSFGTAQLSHQVASFSSSGNNTVITRVTGTIKVYGLLLSCASSVATMTMQNGTSTSLGANQNVTSIFMPIQSEPYYITTSTNNFVINLSSAISCTGWVKYIDS